MRVFCSICKEIFVPFSEVKATKCGHLYHGSCIERWAERNKTCPQCRSHLRAQLFRVYFDVEQGEGADPSTLEHQLETVNEKLREKENLVKSLKEANDNHEEVLGSMKEYSKHLERRNEMFKNSLVALKERFSNELKKNEKLESDLELYMNKANDLKGLERILNGASEDVTDMLKNVPVTSQSVKQLCTYVQVLKEQNRLIMKEKDKFAKMLAEERKKNCEESKKIYDSHVENLKKTNTHLTKLVNENKKKINDLEESKTKNLEPNKEQQKKPSSKNDVLDVLHQEEVASKANKTQTKKIDVINNWEDIVCAGPSKGFKRCQSLSAGSSSKTELSRSSSYAFDGMGGSKKIRMSSVFEKRQEKLSVLMDQNKIYKYFLNND